MLKHLELKDPKSCLNKAKDDEPLFVLLGRDPAAPLAIASWINHRIEFGKNHPGDDQITEAIDLMKKMEDYRAAKS